MGYPMLLGQNFLNEAKIRLKTDYEKECENIMNIEVENESLVMNDGCVSNEFSEEFQRIFGDCYLNCKRPDKPEVEWELKINLKSERPFSCSPRRLSYGERQSVQQILDELLEKGIIRPSMSEYASPIVLVRKKSGELRLCVDYRELNKNTCKDNFPLPLIDDLLDRLVNKRFFSLLDLKSAFYHVNVNDESVKYTSFVTPMGQYEFLKMPFGLKNAPPTFQRFVSKVFNDEIRTGKLAIYLDDIMVATETVKEHLEILAGVFRKLVRNCLELRLDKCNFMKSEIRYLGYIISKDGIRPDTKNIKSIENFPIPRNTRAVHSFLGLCSYFRRFIENFSIEAQPLYALIRKNARFKFGEEEIKCFERLKSRLIEAPILAIYDHRDETELHCDASSLGFGAILLQRKSDGIFHPVFYFSKRATDCESKYHSFELETLAIVYALRRFRIYLEGVRFKIVTDCNSLTLTLNKREINPRIARWALELQNYDYTLEHRAGTKMRHVDALSRLSSILVLEENTFEQNLSICQYKDEEINRIRSELEDTESKWYEMRNGLVYRKTADSLLFYVPTPMENSVLVKYHDEMGHMGCDKVMSAIMTAYWFPKMKEKIRVHIENCLKCIAFSAKTGKHEGMMHSIPKGNAPFQTIHIDHFGPVSLRKCKKRYVFLVIDAFTKFVKLYAVCSTGTGEVLRCMRQYFNSYSRPRMIVSDRGSAFTSAMFVDFLSDNNIRHVKIATGSPQANGQVERVNRSLGPMIAKLTAAGRESSLDKVLPDIEFAMNNMEHRSTGTTPSELLFGVRQRGIVIDFLREKLEEIGPGLGRNLVKARDEAARRIVENQEYNSKLKDRNRVESEYKVGDYVMVRNYISTPGACRKMAPKFKGPYRVSKVLGNDRYVVRDVEGFQLTQIPYEGIWEAANLKKWLNGAQSGHTSDEIGTIWSQDGRTVGIGNPS